MGASNCVVVVVADVRMMIPGGGGGVVCPTPLEMQICAWGCHASRWVSMMDVTSQPASLAHRHTRD